MTHLSQTEKNLIPISAEIDGINVISIYDCDIEREISQIPIADGVFNLLSLSSDSKKIVYTADFKSITIIDLENKEKQIVSFFVPKSRISAILQTSDPEHIIIIFPGLIFQVHLKTGKVIRKASTLYPIITATQIPGKPDEALFGYNDKCIEIKKLFGHTVRWRVQVPSAIYSIQAILCDDQDLIISVYTNEKKIYIFNLYSVTPIYTKIISLQSSAILKNNRILLADSSGSLELWDIRSNSLVATKNFVINVKKIYPFSNKLFVILDDGAIFRLDPKTLDDITSLKTIEYHPPLIINKEYHRRLPSPVILPFENPFYPETIAFSPTPEFNLPQPNPIPSEISVPCSLSLIEKSPLPSPVILPFENPFYPETIAFSPTPEFNLPQPNPIPSEISVPCSLSLIEKSPLPSPVILPFENPFYPETIAFSPTPEFNLPQPNPIPSEISVPCSLSLIEKSPLPSPVILPFENPFYPETIAFSPTPEFNLPQPNLIPSEISVPCSLSLIEKSPLPSPVILPFENPFYPETIAFSPTPEFNLPQPNPIPSEISVPCSLSLIEKSPLPSPVILSFENPFYPETIAFSPTPEFNLPQPNLIPSEISVPCSLSLIEKSPLPSPVILPLNNSVNYDTIARARLGFDLFDGCVKVNVLNSDNLRVFYDSKEIKEKFVSVDCKGKYEIKFNEYNSDNFRIINLIGITDEKPYLIFLFTDDFCPNKKEVPQQDFIVVTSKYNRIIPENKIQGGGDVVNWVDYQWYILSFNNDSVYSLETPNNSYILREPSDLIPFITGGKRILNLPVTIDTQIYSEFPDLVIPGVGNNWSLQIFHRDNLVKVSSHFSPWPKNVAYNYLPLNKDLTRKIGKFTIIVTSPQKPSKQFIIIIVPKLLIEFVMDGPFSVIDGQQKSIQVRIQGPDHVMGAKKNGPFFEKEFIFHPENSLPQVVLNYSNVSVFYDNQLIDLPLVPPILYYSIGKKFHTVGVESQSNDLSKLTSSEIDVYIPHYLKFNHFLVELSLNKSFSVLQDLKLFLLDSDGNYIIRKYTLNVFREALILFSPFSRLIFSIVGISGRTKSRGNIISYSSWWLYALKVTKNTIEWCENLFLPHKTRLVFISDNNPDTNYPLIIPNNGRCVVSHQGISNPYNLRFKSLIGGIALSSLETEKIGEKDILNNVFPMLKIFNPEDVCRLLSLQYQNDLITAQIQAICLENYNGALSIIKDNNYDAKLLEAYCHWKLKLNCDLALNVFNFFDEREIKVLYAADIVKRNKLQASMILTMVEPFTKPNSINSIIELDARVNLFYNGIGNINSIYSMAIKVLSAFYFIKPLWDIIANIEKQMGNTGIKLTSFERIYSSDFIWFNEYQKSFRRIIQIIQK